MRGRRAVADAAREKRDELMFEMCKELQPKAPAASSDSGKRSKKDDDESMDVSSSYTLRIGTKNERVHPIRSGLRSIDASIGIGGYPGGRFVILHGGEGVGKTSALNAAFASAQRQGHIPLMCDVEHKYDMRYAEICGVDPERMFLLKPKTIEAGFDAVQKMSQMLRGKSTDRKLVVGWDSLHSGIAAKALKKGIDDAGGYSPEAGAYSRAIRMIIPHLDECGTLMIATSQVRMDVGSPQAGKEKVGVSKASLHHAVAIGNLRAERKKVAGKVDQQIVECTWVKNQVFDPFGIGRYRIVYGEGIDATYSLFEAARQLGLVNVSGSWVTVMGNDENEIVCLQGIEKVLATMKATPDTMLAIDEAVSARVGTRLERNDALLARLAGAKDEREMLDRLSSTEPVEEVEEVEGRPQVDEDQEEADYKALKAKAAAPADDDDDEPAPAPKRRGRPPKAK